MHAAFVGPTCTSLTASCRLLGLRSFPDMRSSGPWLRRAVALMRSCVATASAFPGSPRPAAPAGTAWEVAKIFATTTSLPATPWMEDTRSTSSPTIASASPCRLKRRRRRLHRGYVRALSGTGALRAAGEARRLGIYGFGAAAHIVAQVAGFEGREVFAFTRPGDTAAQALARTLGAVWAGTSKEASPSRLDAAIIFAPVGSLVPLALRNVAKGGTVVCAGIHVGDIPQFPYELLWGERHICSVANLTRRDGIEFIALAPRIPISTHIVKFPMCQANDALDALRAGTISGAAVLALDDRPYERTERRASIASIAVKARLDCITGFSSRQVLIAWSYAREPSAGRRRRHPPHR